MIHLDDMVRIALEVPPDRRDVVAGLLTREDPEARPLLASVLERYRRPAIAWPPEALPFQVGPFQLVAELGDRARHRDVYLARRAHLEGFVVVKFFRPEGRAEDFVERLRQEASLARRISGEHVVTVFDAGRIPDGPWYVEMEAVGDPDPASRLGFQVAQQIGQAGLGPDEAARQMELVARTVGKAHALGIVHGDLKPQNVLLTPISKRVKLIDFDLARMAGEPGEGRGQETQAGTPEYMAPEQWRDRRPQSEKTDVYALGATLFHLLAGRPPYPGRRKNGSDEKAELPSTVDVRLREIVARAMAERPEDRHASATELADELRRYRLHEPTIDDRRNHRTFGLFCRRHRAAVVVGSVMLAVSIVATGAAVMARLKLDRLTDELIQVNKDLAKREAALAQAGVDIDKTGIALVDLQRAQQHIKDLGREKDALSRRLEAVKGELAQASAVAGETKAILDTTVAAARERATALEERVTRQAGEIASLVAAKSQVDGELKVARIDRERAEKRVAELRDDKDALRELVDAEQKRRAAAEAKSERLEKELAQAKQLRSAPPAGETQKR